MTEALAARATSLGASALLMSGIALIALTVTYTLPKIDLGPAPGPIEMVRPEPPPPPPTRVTRPQAPPLETPREVLPLPPIADVNDTSETTPDNSGFLPAAPMEITAPRWLRRPHDLARYYPARALARNIEGEVVLDCLVSTAGALQCRVLSETPRGWDFAEAALDMARDHQMAAAMAGGQAVQGRYRMRVPFEIE